MRGATRGAGVVGSGGVGVVGLCSSMRSRSVGGTTRPGAGFAASGAGGSRGDSGAGAAVTGGAAASIGAGACGTSAAGGGATGSGAATSTAGASKGGASGSGAGAGVGFAVLTSRGGGRSGAAGLGGSGALLAGAAFFPPFGAGVSAKMSPVGSVMFRWRARRSTNCRATTSSMVLEALFTSIP